MRDDEMIFQFFSIVSLSIVTQLTVSIKYLSIFLYCFLNLALCFLATCDRSFNFSLLFHDLAADSAAAILHVSFQFFSIVSGLSHFKIRLYQFSFNFSLLFQGRRSKR